MLTTRLVVGADGVNSWLCSKTDIPLTLWDYHHHTPVAVIRTAEPHQVVACQAFHSESILALLPLSNPHLCSIVRSLSLTEAKRMQETDKVTFNQVLNITFGNGFGPYRLAGEREVFPLTGRCARQFAAHHLALVGDVAYTVRPLVGQGVNLGFMDVTGPIDESGRLHAQGKDIDQHSYLCRYERGRKHSAALILAGMQGFRKTFPGSHSTKRFLHDMGLKLADSLPGVKPQPICQAMGLSDLPAWLC